MQVFCYYSFSFAKANSNVSHVKAVHFSAVQLEIRAVLVRLVAAITLMRLYSRVHKHVLFQGIRIRESLAAEIALVRLHAVVYSLVVFELRLESVGVAAHIAHVQAGL